MKTPGVTIVACGLLLAGCSQQFSNEQSILNRLQERDKYQIHTPFTTARTNRYGRDIDDYGPRINLVKLIWGDRTAQSRAKPLHQEHLQSPQAHRQTYQEATLAAAGRTVEMETQE
jgi:hypothetical protein